MRSALQVILEIFPATSYSKVLWSHTNQPRFKYKRNQEVNVINASKKTDRQNSHVRPSQRVQLTSSISHVSHHTHNNQLNTLEHHSQ